MADRSSTSRKRPLNVSVREDLAEQAKALGTNVSAVLERALQEEIRAKQREAWQLANRGAISAWNEWLEENGLPLADLRPW